MNKWLVSMSAAAVAAGAVAVESANVVGVTTKNINANQFYLVGVQFQGVGEDGVANINDFFTMSGVSAVLYDNMFSSAARIDVLNAAGTGYISYYYISDADDGSETYDITGWADGNGEIIDVSTLNLGEGFWFHTPTAASGATISVHGEVTSETELSVAVPAGGQFAILNNPFPAAVNLSDVETSGISAVLYDNMFTSAARIDVLNAAGTGYISYYYISDADDGSETYDITGWADGNGEIVDSEVIDTGASFWIHSANAGTLTFSL